MRARILVVDDDQDIVHILKTTLEKNSYEVMTAPNGAEALRTIKTYAPDLMIVDLTMPVMSGWNFSMKARQDDRYKNTPIIMLSGLVEHERPAEKFESGTVYIGKPFDIFKLMDKVKELLKNPSP